MCCNVAIKGVKGGTAHNAIPMDAHCNFCIPADKVEEAKKIVEKLNKEIAFEYRTSDPTLKVTIEDFECCC